MPAGYARRRVGCTREEKCTDSFRWPAAGATAPHGCTTVAFHLCGPRPTRTVGAPKRGRTPHGDRRSAVMSVVGEHRQIRRGASCPTSPPRSRPEVLRDRKEGFPTSQAAVPDPDRKGRHNGEVHKPKGAELLRKAPRVELRTAPARPARRTGIARASVHNRRPASARAEPDDLRASRDDSEEG